MDIQFNPGNGTSQLAAAHIGGVNAGGGTLLFNVNSPQTAGDVSGTMPGTVTLVNDTAFNDYFQQFIFGDFVSFTLSLDGPALSAPNGTSTAGSVFGVGLYDENQNSILTNHTDNGFAGSVVVNLDGSTTSIAYPTATGGPSVFSTDVPEPDSVWIAGLALVGIALARRWRSRSAGAGTMLSRQ